MDDFLKGVEKPPRRGDAEWARAAILAAAAEVAMHHPSKDARSFAAEVSDYVLFLSTQAGALQAVELTDAARDVLAERQQQINVEGWTPAHDDEHGDGSMAMAAAAYAVSAAGHTERSFFVTSLWKWTGWASSWFKPKGQRRDLVCAAALLIAEIERIDRAKARIRPDGFPTWICQRCTNPGYCSGSLQGCDIEEINK